MSEQFSTCNINDLLLDSPLPVPIYLYINFRFITLRGESDVFDETLFNRLQKNRVELVFIKESDKKKLQAWIDQNKKIGEREPSSLISPIEDAREDSKRKLLDIFRSSHPNKLVHQTLDSSKKLAKELMSNSFAVKSLTQLQTYGRGTVNHSVNVSILSAYLAMQMGYSHAVILQHVCAGGLLHDVGKALVKINDEDTEQMIEEKMKEHPLLAIQMLKTIQGTPEEVKMIVSQCHEYYDGSGFPNKLRGSAIYDLARIVTIAEEFDNIVCSSLFGTLSLEDRQKKAVEQMDQKDYKKFDPIKLKKALKVLKLGV